MREILNYVAIGLLLAAAFGLRVPRVSLGWLGLALWAGLVLL